MATMVNRRRGGCEQLSPLVRSGHCNAEIALPNATAIAKLTQPVSKARDGRRIRQNRFWLLPDLGRFRAALATTYAIRCPLAENDLEFVVSVRAKRPQANHFRQFRSGMVGIVPGQVVRINVVNTGVPGSLAKIVWEALTGNPRSELLGQTTFSLEPGASAFFDLDWDAMSGGDEKRHQVRAQVTVLDDPEGVCLVTLEVFDKETGKTTVLMQLQEAPTVDVRGGPWM